MIHNEADAIVIGGGITGSSIALRLAEKGQRVILLEKGRVGEEASGRCGGGVRQQGRLAPEIPLAMESIKIWANMHDELAFDVGYRRNGNLLLALTPEDYTSFQQTNENEKTLGLNSEMLSPKEVRALVPALAEGLNLVGGKYCATDGSANPLLVVKAISRAARRKGVEIREHEAVTGLTHKAGRVTSVITSAGEYHGGVVVNAAGPWARKLCNLIGLDFPLTTHRDHLLVTETLPHRIEPFLSFSRMYLRQTLEGNVHITGAHHRIEDFDKRVSYGAFAYAANGVANVLPHLSKANVIRAFSGVTDYITDGIPILDRAPNMDNFFLAAGFTGHGFCLGPIVGRLFSEWIADGRPSLNLDAFRWTRFKDIYI